MFIPCYIRKILEKNKYRNFKKKITYEKNNYYAYDYFKFSSSNNIVYVLKKL